MSGSSTTPPAIKPVVFNRSGSMYGTEDPESKSNGEDPRSPGVPRTPGAERKSVKTYNSPTAKRSSRATEEPESPLASIITQTDANGTPKSAGRLPVDYPSSPKAEAKSGGSSDIVKAGPDGERGNSIAEALCCCWHPQQGHDEHGQKAPMAKGTGDNDAAAAAGGGSSRASNGSYSGGASASNGGARRGKSSSASFGTFHYDDPAHPADKPILPPVAAQDKGKLCLVLDLDETLVHSSFRAVPNPDYIIPVKIEDVVHQVYVCKRPGVDEFMRRVGERYEIIIYTASLNKYADPLLDMLDKHRVIRHRLFRESCTQYQGNYVKNLSLLGRDLSTCIIVDNSPLSYLFHPENAIGCISWIDQKDDDELRVIADFCERIEEVDDIRLHMRSWRQGGRYNPKTISG